jgi:hypothetical protein
MEKQHGHAVLTCSMIMVHRHAAWKFIMDMQRRHAELHVTGTLSMDMKHGHKA